MHTPTNKPVDLDCATPRRRTRLGTIKTVSANIVAITSLVATLTMAANAKQPVATPPVTPAHSAQSQQSVHATSERDASVSSSARPHDPSVDQIENSVVDKPSATSARNSSILGEERRVLIGLLFLCFAVMTIGGFGLWRRGMEDLLQSRKHSDRR